MTVTDLAGNKQHRSRMFLTLAEAKRELAKEVSGRNPNAGMTLTQWHERYWPAIAASVRVGTARGYDVSWRKRVQPTLGDKKLEEITSPLIESAMVSWAGSPSIKVDSLAVLSRLLDGARRARIIDYNPAREVKRPSQDTSTSPTSRALTVQQIRKLLELIPAGVYRRYAAALVFTGMRAGEATAQRVRDAELEQNILRISRSFSPGKNGELIEQSPKSHKEREAPITKQLRPSVIEAIKGKERDDLLWAGPNGGRLTARNFRRAVDWEKIKTELHRPELRVHDLRHTFATILFDAGASAPDVQAVLGHSSLQVTERYSRAREGVARRAGSVLDGLFEPDKPKPKKNTKKSSKTSGAKKSRRSSASPNLADPFGVPFNDPFGTAGYSTGHGNGPRMAQGRGGLGL
ncbi:tyrosine-type recombinase/integrase [Leucobacter triazinivorans]|uniref:tyrosine-type recombinase/integrase n=1 Tax=Leucobacter triazinivorans TaxID=1784719 RepID=UPI0013EE4437|nr:site-specific integrase [Leucobacter triazinivorans]